jgi:hypothetical protein
VADVKTARDALEETLRLVIALEIARNTLEYIAAMDGGTAELCAATAAKEALGVVQSQLPTPDPTGKAQV